MIREPGLNNNNALWVMSDEGIYCEHEALRIAPTHDLPFMFEVL